MAKKINSEYVIENNSEFTVTMGTSDKKNPEVIYSIISTYITPNEEEINEKIFDNIFTTTKKMLKEQIANLGVCNKDIIVVSDVASNRMQKGKQSYFDMQIYFKPLKTTDMVFKKTSEKIYNTYVKNAVNYIENTLKSNGFTTSNKKNKQAKA